ncbi:MAG: hypothetical protein VKJ46_08095 [Leptolyngbyaceae bacterium]|nr:hypothetical protein [Leptolyngbyaceae bacterium]
MPEIGLSLGYEEGEHLGWRREWLYWYDETGNRYLTDAERAEQAQQARVQAEAIATQARQEKEQERQQKEKLANYLRSLGLNPDDIP